MSNIVIPFISSTSMLGVTLPVLSAGVTGMTLKMQEDAEATTFTGTEIGNTGHYEFGLSGGTYKLYKNTNQVITSFGGAVGRFLSDGDEPKYVHGNSNETITGTKTFITLPQQQTYAAPTTDVQLAPKAYVDGRTVASALSASFVTTTTEAQTVQGIKTFNDLIINGAHPSAPFKLLYPTTPANGTQSALVVSIASASNSATWDFAGSKIQGAEIVPESITGITRISSSNYRMNWPTLQINSSTFTTTGNFAAQGSGAGNKLTINSGGVNCLEKTSVIFESTSAFFVGALSAGESAPQVFAFSVRTDGMSTGGKGTVDFHNSTITNFNIANIPNPIGNKQRYVDVTSPIIVANKFYNTVDRAVASCPTPDVTNRFDILLLTPSDSISSTPANFTPTNYVNLIGQANKTRYVLQTTSYNAIMTWKNMKIRAIDPGVPVSFTNCVFEDCELHLDIELGAPAAGLTADFTTCELKNTLVKVPSNTASLIRFNGGGNRILDCSLNKLTLTSSGDIYLNTLTAASLTSFTWG